MHHISYLTLFLIPEIPKIPIFIGFKSLLKIILSTFFVQERIIIMAYT